MIDRVRQPSDVEIHPAFSHQKMRKVTN